jgi:hypothetical protein
MIVARPSYRLELDGDGRRAVLSSPAGEHWLTLNLLAAFDTLDGLDETLGLSSMVEGDTVTVERESTRWAKAGMSLVCGDETLEVRAWVEGEGLLADVHLLGGRLVPAAGASGFFPSGRSLTRLFSPNPGDPARLVRGAGEAAVIGVSGDGQLGRGHWFFTPAPLFLALSDDAEDGWLGLGIAAPVGELTFVQALYRPGDRAFHLVLEHEGHTAVEGRHHAPVLVLFPGLDSPYEGIAAQRHDLARRGAAPPARERNAPGWWSRPMFCGWGAQCHLSSLGLGAAPALATQENYDRFLGALADHGLVPATVVIDDKWQSTYGANEPDAAKWPDLKRWIADRHALGQHVLLWWKAWDPEGLPEELCIRRPDGLPVAFDPTNPRARELLAGVMHELCGPDGLDADGLKIDFTARTPSGSSLRTHGRGWGIALLHQLLEVVYAGVKEIKPDALVITQTPHPSFADVTDMVRLNDMLRLDDPGPVPAAAVVPQMRYRAAIAHAALPDVLVDTDDWCVPDKQTWRAYLEAKQQLGVQSLYYATHLDLTGEALDEDDYAALRRAWAAA